MSYIKFISVAIISFFGFFLVGAIFVPSKSVSSFIAGENCRKLAYALDDRPSNIEIIDSTRISVPMTQSEAIDWAAEKFGENGGVATAKLINSNYSEGRSMYSIYASMDYSSISGRTNITCLYINGPSERHLELTSVLYGQKSYTNFVSLNLKMLASAPSNYERPDTRYIDNLHYLISFSFLSN